jgi:hypothetical protein
MIQERSIEFASRHRQTNPVVVQAIIALSSDDRPPETIWRTPTANEWRRVARVVAENSDDDSAIGDDRMAWAFLLRLSEGTLRVCKERCPH